MAFWSSACPTVELILEKVLILNPVDFHFKVELKTLYNNFVGDEPLVVSGGKCKQSLYFCFAV